MHKKIVLLSILFLPMILVGASCTTSTEQTNTGKEQTAASVTPAPAVENSASPSATPSAEGTNSDGIGGGETNTNTSVDTSDWLTYENNKYKFTIKYPYATPYINERYSGDKEKNKITQVDGNEYATPLAETSSLAIGWGPDSFLTIDFLPNNQSLSLLDFIDSQIDKDNPNILLTIDAVKSQGKEISISGKNGYAFSSDQCCIYTDGLSDGEVQYIFFPYNQYWTVMMRYPITNKLDSYDEEHKAVFETMASTFQFF